MRVAGNGDYRDVMVVMPRFGLVRFRDPFCRTVTHAEVRVSWEADLVQMFWGYL